MLHYYDAGLLPRSWKTIRRFFGFTYSIAPPYGIENWSYTIPTGRRAILIYACINIIRVIASTTAENWGSNIKVGTQLLMPVYRFSPYKDSYMLVTENLYLPFVQGETVAGESFDVNTDGRISHRVIAVFLEL